MYKLLIETISKKVTARFDRDIDARASGIIVNTSGWIDGPGFDVLLHIVNSLSIDIVLVMNHDRLHSSLLAALGEGVTVVKLVHSGGVVQRVCLIF
jgi:polyribonucleotide 5'-hydroxyl-kinase